MRPIPNLQYERLNPCLIPHLCGDRKSKEKVFTLISDEPSNQTELAESYGITKQTMNNYMRMASMIPELEDLVDTGIVTKDTALAIMQPLLM